MTQPPAFHFQPLTASHSSALQQIEASLRHLLAQNPLLTPDAQLVFETLSSLGEGGMGKVYRVRDKRLERDAALKILSDALADETMRQRFVQAPRVIKRTNDDIDTRRILENAGTRQIAPLRKVASNVPSSLASIVMTAVATDPQHRYANFAELARDLRRFLDGEEVHTVSSPLMMLWRRVRLKALLVIFGMLCIALVFSSGYYARVISSQDDSLESLKSDRNLWQSAYCKAQRRYIEELLNQNRKQEAKKQARALFRKCPELANSEAFADLRQRLFKSP